MPLERSVVVDKNDNFVNTTQNELRGMAVAAKYWHQRVQGHSKVVGLKVHK